MQRPLNRNQNIAMTALAAQRKILPYTPEYQGPMFGERLVIGPVYRANRTSFWEDTKEKAVDHVLGISQHSLLGIMTVIGNIEAQVKAAYADHVVNVLTGPELQMIMVVDGCFFLLLAFSILGAGTKLMFPDDHPIFGTGYVNHYMEHWLESMFFLGNQIPFIVLEKLMGLRFFKGLKATFKSKQQLELEKRTLHKFLVVDQNPKPMDLIHCLQSVMLGPRGRSNNAVGKRDVVVADIVTASKLSKRGTKFQKLEEEVGIRGMRYEGNTFGDVLYLPVLRVDYYTKLLVQCLLKYETAQEPRGFEPEASSFFKFMCELIHTSQDVEVLESEGVVQGHSESLPGLLRTLDRMVSCRNMHSVKREIVGNHPWQWRKYLKWIAIITILGFVLTFLQTFYTIFPYYNPRKS